MAAVIAPLVNDVECDRVNGKRCEIVDQILSNINTVIT